MTVYSRHPNRGKTQILATWRDREGVVSSTVTSVDTAAAAEPIVDALNRISACATVPLGVHDTRHDELDHFPTGHLDALTDRNARPALLVGAHGVWYEYVKLRLHDALVDLDAAVESVPAPVRAAIEAELEAEARGLRDAVAEEPEVEPAGRHLEFGAPLVVPGAAEEGARELLDRAERGVPDAEREEIVADLRWLVEVCRRCADPGAELSATDFMITADPGGPHRLYLQVDVPEEDDGYGPSMDFWSVGLGRWTPDDPDDEEAGATGEVFLRCARTTRPAVDEVVEVLDLGAGNAEQLAVWARTPVGEPLVGTAFVVTERFGG
ncbi:hypothetical protein [Actinosynnema sp. NPDC020468]|uniref:hypothetical protein n=1 Tax=Actinosynnema sp. NPDC020468 TaxID=3154488 RepID=UPI003411C22C